MKSRRTLTAVALLVALAFFATGCATTKTSQATAPAADTSWQYTDIVDAAFVGQYAKVPMPADVMIIDSRPFKPKYIKGHIPMAVSIPFSQMDKMLDKLPANKDTLLIFYCGGVKCKLSHKAAYKAESLGYKNVKVFAKGYPGWLKVDGNYGTVSVEYMKAQFDKFKAQLPEDKATPLVFYCGGLKCKLSHKSAAKAIAMGYTNVKVFATGYPSWKAYAGKPGTGSAIKAGKEEGSIDIAAFKKIIADDPKSIYLVDVRDADEFATGSFKSAINIPVENLEAKVKDLPSNLPIVFVCSTGARSGESFYMLQDLRPELKKVYYLEAEITFNKDGSFTIVEPQS